MRTIEELREFFHTHLGTELQGLESERVAVLNRVVVVCGILGLLAAAGTVFFLIAMGGEGVWVPLFLGGGSMYLVFAFLTQAYRSRFKDVVIGPLVCFFDENLKYSKDGCILSGIYAQSKIFLQQPDRFRGDDFVQGMLGSTRIMFSELHTEYRTETADSRGRRQTQWHTIFKGLFFTADFNKHFHGRTVVLPDRAEKMFGGLGQFFQSRNAARDPLVRMDDPEFEKTFVVYGTDQIEARYILSSSLMKRIVDFQKKAGRRIYLSFVNSSIFIAIPYTKNLFEPNVFRTLLDFSVIEEYFTDLKTALDIVEELNLNTRIWSKE